MCTFAAPLYLVSRALNGKTGPGNEVGQTLSLSPHPTLLGIIQVSGDVSTHPSLEANPNSNPVPTHTSVLTQGRVGVPRNLDWPPFSNLDPTIVSLATPLTSLFTPPPPRKVQVESWRHYFLTWYQFYPGRKKLVPGSRSRDRHGVLPSTSEIPKITR